MNLRIKQARTMHKAIDNMIGLQSPPTDFPMSATQAPEDRIKILFFVPALVGGGAERVVTTLLRNLSRDRFDVALAIVSRRGDVLSSELPPDLTLIDLDCSRARYALPRVVRLIRSLQPDIVFSTLDYFNVALGITRFLWPSRTSYIARPTLFLHAVTQERRIPLLWDKLTGFALSRADGIVFQSPDMREDYRQALALNQDNASVIGNPLDFAFVHGKAEEERTEVPFDPSCFNLVAAGRLEKQKGFDLAIEAMALSRNPDIHLTILGDGSLRRDLERYARELLVQDRVHFAGYRPNPYPYYAQADGFLLSSRHEGFPNVVLEALSCGTPVVATPVSGLGNIIRTIPQCRLAAGFTAPQIANAIDSLAEAGRQRVAPDAVSAFDSKNVIAQYEDMFARVRQRRHAMKAAV